MKSPRLLMPFAFLVVIGLATAFAVLVPEPDVRSARSDDGRLEVRGVGDPAQPIAITKHEGFLKPNHVIDPLTYTLTLGGQPLPSLFKIRMIGVSPSDTVFAYDETLLAWRPLFTSYDSITGAIEADAVPSAHTYGSGVRPILSPPKERGSVLNTLMTGAPPGAIGFEATDAVAFAEDEFILLAETFARGGCSGRFETGKSTTVSTQEIPLGEATYRILVRWQLNGGCSPFAPLTISPSNSPLVY